MNAAIEAFCSSQLRDESVSYARVFPGARYLKSTVYGLICSLVFLSTPAQAQTSQFIDSIPVGSSWQNVTSSEGNNLRVDHQVVAYSGGGTANGRTVVFGGGHNNGMSDSVAFLDWRNFETIGWVEELPSTADHIGVGDFDFAEIGAHLNANYNPATPGGIIDERGPVALSRHTYDQIVVRDDHFYMFSGVLPYDNPGQPNEPWADKEGDIWRYDFGQGWSFVDAPFPRGFVTGHAAAASDTLTGKIWVHEERGLRLFDPDTGQVGPIIDYLNSQEVESFMNFNAEKGAEGTLFGAGTYAGSNWHEYDIATGQQTNMGRVPGNASNTYMIYIDSSFGADYGTYFAFVPQDGTLRRWNGSGWDTVATGGPSSNDYVYGRVGFEEVHQVFYWIHNPYTNNTAWRTYVVRPFAFSDSVEPRPTVSLNADPETVAQQGTSTLNWTTFNATSCNASDDWSGSRPVSGSEIVGPLSSDQTYTLTCSGAGGTATDSVVVTVVAASPPPTVTLTANPDSVQASGFAVLDWTSANAQSCEASGAWQGSRDPQGSESVGPIESNQTFTLTCTGAGGTATDSVVVTVVGVAAPPTVTLTASPDSVEASGSAALEWTSANADSCEASGAWQGSKDLQGSESVGPISADSEFLLSCTGAGGQATDVVTVRVIASNPPPGNDPGSNDPVVVRTSGSGGTGAVDWLMLFILSGAGWRSIGRRHLLGLR
jgi:hypothetical protein